MIESIGLNHQLETALADLVDNSVDAGAHTVLIRFVRGEARLAALAVVDDGKGMDEAVIDQAMTIGSRTDYEPDSLGHFGIGLKAASLGQAESLTVCARAHGAKAVGRRWLKEKATQNFECDVIDPSFAADALDRDWGIVRSQTGTVIRWDGVRDFPRSTNPGVTDRYLEDMTVRIRRHLGLVFHRILTGGDLTIAIDVEDLTMGDQMPPSIVEPIDPFGYMRTGRPRYPKALPVKVEGVSLELQCHIWPGRSQLPSFKLNGGAVEFQGMYFYRNNRLLQIGGWNGIVHPERHYQLARIAIDIDDSGSHLFRMNPEKTRIEAHARFAEAVSSARTRGGFSLSQYLEDAAAAFKESRKRKRERPRVIPPGKGFSPRIKRAIERELEFIHGEDPFDIRWTSFGDDSFFELDREDRVVWLNADYRDALVGAGRGSLNDVPMIKALLYLLMEERFRGAYLGSRDKDLLELFNEILTAAAQAERSGGDADD